MKKRFLLIAASALLFIISLYVNNSAMAKQCNSGGPGAISCAVAKEVSIFGPNGIEIKNECEVTCGPGTYACCSGPKSCICLPNSGGPDGPGGNPGGDGDSESGGDVPPTPPGGGNGNGDGNGSGNVAPPQ